MNNKYRGAETRNRLIRLASVREMTGLSRAAIYKLIAVGCFPKQIRLTGARAVGWLESEVQDWIEACIAARGVVIPPATPSKETMEAAA